MTTEKRIVFSNETPNDQGGIIPNDCFDFSRYNANPILLAQHDWDGATGEYFKNILGRATDLQLINNKWTFIPDFHEYTDESKLAKKMYDGGYLVACSVGGEAIWKTTGKYIMDEDGNRRPEYFLNEQGLRICLRFVVYEISMVGLPSNPDAVKMQSGDMYIRCFTEKELTKINSNIVKFNSQLQTQIFKTMTEEENKAADIANEEAAKVAEQAKLAADTDKAKTAKEELGSELPSVIKDIVGATTKLIDAAKSMFESKTVEEAPRVLHDNEPGGGDKVLTLPGDNSEKQPEPIGLGAIDKAKKEAEKLTEAAKLCNQEAEKAKQAAEECDEAEKATKQAEAEKAKEKAEKATKEADEAKSKLKKLEADEAELDEEKAKAEAEKKETEKSTNKTTIKMEKKTQAELDAENIKLAAKPEVHVKTAQFAGKTLTELRSDKGGEGEKLLMRTLTKDASATKEMSDYAALGTAILNDPRLSAIADKVRIVQNIDQAQLGSLRSNPNARLGVSLKEIVTRLASGTSETVNFKTGARERMTTLSGGTDYALANPDTLAIEWLTLAIFKLFPDNTWKSEIPLFGVQQTANNTGVIWTNITADPTIYKGTKPTTPSDYAYSDTAVALKLVPYWLQPMIWEPLTMHQLRYDQMGTGWAQAFAKWDSVMDDDLLYVLASTVPGASMVNTTGGAFNIAATTDPDGFYWGSFTGSLAKPVLNDIIRLEQIYQKQNFDLEANNATVVLDPTAYAYLTQDSEVKNKLTEWKTITGGTFQKFRNTVIKSRSRVAIYDSASGLVKDPTGVIPSTATSANVSFIPSQVGMGLGMLDVFMLQDPTNYGYKISADIRKGIVPLRANFNGTGLLNYGTPNV